LISQIYFWNKTPHVSDSSSVHHQEFFTAHTTMVYVIQVCWQFDSDQDQDIPSWSCSQAVSKPVWHIPLLCVQWKPLVDGQRNCLIYVEFYSKNKFEKSVHLVGFIIRIYHEARSRERQIGIPSWSCSLSSCQQTCMTHTIALCTVKNSWWWTEELSDICRFLFQK